MALQETRRGKNAVFRLDGVFWESVFGRLAGYEDINDPNRLALDPVMRQGVGGRAVDAQAASASQIRRFEAKTLASPANREALADLDGHWIDLFHDRNRSSSSCWTRTTHSARRTAIRKVPPGTCTSIAPATTRTSCYDCSGEFWRFLE